ncbi:MAG: nuclear transport factor 2 family protein [Myxococcota bacterium]
MTPEEGNAFVARYLRAIETKDLRELDAIFDDRLVQIEHPNVFSPDGGRHDKQAMLAGIERGANLLREERYVPIEVVVMGDRLACRLVWEAQLAVDLGSTKAGSVLQANLALFMTVRDGRIVELTNYDCVTPFA